MYMLLMALVHAAVSSLAALAIAPHSPDPTATSKSLWALSMVSTLLSTIGFAATALYLATPVKPFSGVQVGLLCGVLCSGVFGLTLAGVQYSLVLYLAMLVPTLAAVLLASLLARSKSGWQG